MAQAEQRFGKLGLTVALHPCNRQDFAGLNIERDAVDGKLFAVIFNMDVFDAQDQVATLLSDRLVDFEVDFTANHHCGKFTSGAGWLSLANDLALTNHSDFV